MTINITAAIRKDKTDNSGLVPIYIYIYSGSKRISRIPIGQKIIPAFWDADKKRVSKKHADADMINALIGKKISDLNTQAIGETITTGTVNISLLANREKIKNLDFYAFAEKQILEKNYAIETRRNYRVYVEKIKGYRKTLKLSEINFQFLQGYEAYLRDVLKNESNTVWANLKFINTLTNDALKSKYLIEDPFQTYSRPKYKQTKRSFLNAGELESIEKFLSTNEDESLKVVGSYFLFMAYTGLRFSDAIRFNASHIIDNERIVIETQKTKMVTNLFINEKIKELIKFVNNNPLRITQVDYNRKLKLIAAYCGVRKKISSHVARHSFGASLVALGVPERVAQGLLAHSSAASTKIYYHLQNDSLDEAMKKFNQ